MASASNRIGETNDIPAPKPGRGGMSLTHARLEYPRESRFPDLPRLRHVHRCLRRGHRQGLQPGSAAPVGGAAHRDNLRRDRGHHPSGRLAAWPGRQPVRRRLGSLDRLRPAGAARPAHDPQRPARGSCDGTGKARPAFVLDSRGDGAGHQHRRAGGGRRPGLRRRQHLPRRRCHRPGHHDHGHPRHHARPGARRGDRQARGDGRRGGADLVGATILYEHLSAA